MRSFILAAPAALLAASALAARAGEASRKLPTASDPGRPCVLRKADGLSEPKDLDALLGCQAEFRQTWVGRYVEKLGRQPSDAALDRFDDLQRSEVRDYLARHPDRAATSDEKPAPKKARGRAAPSKDKKPAGRCRPGAAAWEQASAKDKEMSGQWPKTTEAMDRNLESRDPALQADLRDLGSELLRSSDGGRAGVSPEAARAVLDFLTCQQGGATAEMRRLLESVSTDGAKLQDSTILQLKRAARDAKGRDLDLGVGKDLEKWLLDPKTDPEVGVDDLAVD